MLHALYIIAFVVVTFLALRNLVNNLFALGLEQQKPKKRRSQSIPHPELLDSDGNLTDEPLLVIRSANLEDARSQLDSLYYNSPDESRES